MREVDVATSWMNVTKATWNESVFVSLLEGEFSKTVSAEIETVEVELAANGPLPLKRA